MLPYFPYNDIGFWLADFLESISHKAEFDSSKYYLGSLCKRSHDWNRTGQTLRYKNSRHCVECIIQYGFQYRRSNQEEVAEYQREYYRANQKKIVERNRRYLQNSPEKTAVYQRRYSQTDKGKTTARCKRIKHRLNKLNNHSVPYQTLKVLDLFCGCCVYCGVQSEKLTLDHFLPISKGGTDTEMNVLPCCGSCNSSKCNKDPKEWYFSRDFATKKRWREILKLLGKTDSNYRQLSLL